MPLEESESPEGFYCEVTSFSTKSEYDSNACLNPTTDVIYPGALLDAASLESGAYRSISAPRGSGTLNTSIRNIENVGVFIPDFSKYHVNQELATLLQQQTVSSSSGSSPGTIAQELTTFEIIDAYDENSLELHLGAEFKYSGAQVSSAFNYANQEVNTRLLVKFTQVFYTVEYQAPLSPSEFFAPGTSPADLEDILEPGMVPVWVAWVKYGRMGYYSIESTMTMKEFEAELGINFDGGVYSGGLDLGTKLRNFSQNSSTSAQIYGGSAADASGATKSIDDFFDWIDQGSDYASYADIGAVPVSYKLAYLDDNSTARLSFITDYKIRNCYPITNIFYLNDFYIDPVDVDQNDKDLYGHIYVEAYEDDGSGGRHEVTADNSTSGDVWFNERDTTVELKDGMLTPLGDPSSTFMTENAGAYDETVPMGTYAKDLKYTFDPRMDTNPTLTVYARFKEADTKRYDAEDSDGDGERDDDDDDDESFGSAYLKVNLDGQLSEDGYRVGPFESPSHTKFDLVFHIKSAGAYESDPGNAP